MQTQITYKCFRRKAACNFSTSISVKKNYVHAAAFYNSLMTGNWSSANMQFGVTQSPLISPRQFTSAKNLNLLTSFHLSVLLFNSTALHLTTEESKYKYLWLQASAAMLMRSALFWGIRQRRVVTLYRHFGTTYRYHLQEQYFLTLEDGTDTLSRNVGKGLPLEAALYPRKAEFSSTSITANETGPRVLKNRSMKVNCSW
jgi:hypothetical protein